MRLSALLAALLLAAAPALAQQAAPPDAAAAAGNARKVDKIQPDDAIDLDDAAAARDLMERTLPFKNGQVLRYLDGDGDLVGTARRTRLTIRFYDADGDLVGRAERVSQAVTKYYAADGRYLGRRVHKKQTTRAQVTYDPKGGYDSSDKGFQSSTKPMGQPGEED
jgi:hypothetical protein